MYPETGQEYERPVGTFDKRDDDRQSNDDQKGDPLRHLQFRGFLSATELHREHRDLADQKVAQNKCQNRNENRSLAQCARKQSGLTVTKVANEPQIIAAAGVGSPMKLSC